MIFKIITQILKYYFILIWAECYWTITETNNLGLSDTVALKHVIL